MLAKVLAHNVCCLITAMYEYNLDLSFGTGDSSLQLPSAYYKRRGQDKGLSMQVCQRSSGANMALPV